MSIPNSQFIQMTFVINVTKARPSRAELHLSEKKKVFFILFLISASSSYPMNHLRTVAGSPVCNAGSQGYVGTEEVIFPAPAGHLQPLDRILQIASSSLVVGLIPGE